jgi:rhodanese-related sulfurtransferase
MHSWLTRIPRQAATATLAITVCIACGPPAVAGGQRALTDLEQQIARDHPGVRSLTADQFEARLEGDTPALVLDVREQREFEISRIPGALRVDPAIGTQEFMRRFGHLVPGRTVLLYCSVGVRSSRIAARVDGAVRAAGGAGAYNLTGGVFAWHNTGRHLVDGRGRTDLVHGFDRTWARYVDFDNLTRIGR